MNPASLKENWGYLGAFDQMSWTESTNTMDSPTNLTLALTYLFVITSPDHMFIASLTPIIFYPPFPTAQSPAAAEPSTSRPFHFPQTETMRALEDLLPPPQAGASTLGEISYNTPQNSNLSNQDYENTDELTLLNQLLEMPTFQAMLSDPSLTSSMFPDANSTFGNMDVNFNPNFVGFGQDLSHYNDFQFNQLVNVNQNPLAEPLSQDSPSHLVQVKREEEEEDDL